MKSMLSLLLVCAAVPVSAQETSQAIQAWQSRHPSTLLISSERYENLSPKEHSLLGTDVIVFHDKITLSQLEQYDAEKNTAVAPVATKEEDAATIKNWLGEHPDVLLVSASEFAAMDTAKQQECLDNPVNILVLEGESLTVQDILRYNY